MRHTHEGMPVIQLDKDGRSMVGSGVRPSMLFHVCSTCSEVTWRLDGYKQHRHCDRCRQVTFHWFRPSWEVRSAA